jgi:hypothetical protein
MPDLPKKLPLPPVEELENVQLRLIRAAQKSRQAFEEEWNRIFHSNPGAEETPDSPPDKPE